MLLGDGGRIDHTAGAITHGLHRLELPEGDKRDGQLGRDTGIEIHTFLEFIHVIDEPHQPVDTFQGLPGIVIAVLGRGRDQRACGGLGG